MRAGSGSQMISGFGCNWARIADALLMTAPFRVCPCGRERRGRTGTWLEAVLRAAEASEYQWDGPCDVDVHILERER